MTNDLPVGQEPLEPLVQHDRKASKSRRRSTASQEFKLDGIVGGSRRRSSVSKNETKDQRRRSTGSADSRQEALFHEEVPAGNLRKLLKKMPAHSYVEVDVSNHMNSLKQPHDDTGRAVDVFLNDFFYLRDDLKEGWYLLYLYTPVMSHQLTKKVAAIHQSSIQSHNGLEHMKYTGEAEEYFLMENQGITEATKDGVIRVAFFMKNGRLDTASRRILQEYPILTLPTDAEWPLLRILIIQSQTLRHDCFMKRGNLSSQEMKFLESGYQPAATALLFLDRGEPARTAVIAGENWGQIRLSTTKKIPQMVKPNRRNSNGYAPSNPNPDKRTVVNGRVVFRLASNSSSQLRRVMYSSNEMDKLKATNQTPIPYDYFPYDWQ